MVQLNFTERAARSLNTEAKLRITTPELYDLYTHPEDIQLFIQIVGNNDDDAPSVYIDDVTPETLRYTLSQLSTAALNDCVIWLRAYNGRPLQEFAVVCEARHNDFVVNNCSFRLCDFSAWYFGSPLTSEKALICHEEEVVEAYHKIMNIINNNNN